MCQINDRNRKSPTERTQSTAFSFSGIKSPSPFESSGTPIDLVYSEINFSIKVHWKCKNWNVVLAALNINHEPLFLISLTPTETKQQQQKLPKRRETTEMHHTVFLLLSLFWQQLIQPLLLSSRPAVFWPHDGAQTRTFVLIFLWNRDCRQPPSGPNVEPLLSRIHLESSVKNYVLRRTRNSSG